MRGLVDADHVHPVRPSIVVVHGVVLDHLGYLLPQLFGVPQLAADPGLRAALLQLAFMGPVSTISVTSLIHL